MREKTFDIFPINLAFVQSWLIFSAAQIADEMLAIMLVQLEPMYNKIVINSTKMVKTRRNFTNVGRNGWQNVYEEKHYEVPV